MLTKRLHFPVNTKAAPFTRLRRGYGGSFSFIKSFMNRHWKEIQVVKVIEAITPIIHCLEIPPTTPQRTFAKVNQKPGIIVRPGF